MWLHPYQLCGVKDVDMAMVYRPIEKLTNASYLSLSRARCRCQGPGVVKGPVSVFRWSQFSGLRPRLNDSDTKRLPNTSMYN